MKFKNYLFVLTTVSVILSSCSKEDKDIEQLAILPLSIGNVWTFTDSTFHYYSGGIDVDTSKIKFDYYYEIGDYSGYTSQPVVNGNPITLINTDNEGNTEELLFLADTLVFRTIHFKINASKGEKWTFKTAVYSNGDYSNVSIRELEMQCTCTDTMIQTPKGVFSCKGFSYSPNNGEDTFVSYLSENIGWILMLHYEGNILFRKSTLLDYHLE